MKDRKYTHSSGELNKKWTFEVISWVLTIIVTILVLLPLYAQEIPFDFYVFNIIFIILFLTYLRYIFFLRYTPFSHFTPVKLVFIFIAIPVLFFLVDALSSFQAFNDEVGLQEIVKHLSSNSEQSTMMKYIRTEYLFFGVSSMICAVTLPVRMIISIWRWINKGTV